MSWGKFIYTLIISNFLVVGYTYAIVSKIDNNNPFAIWSNVNFWWLCIMMIFVISYSLYNHLHCKFTDLIPKKEQTQIGELK